LVGVGVCGCGCCSGCDCFAVVADVLFIVLLLSSEKNHR
jgi:hypothetical protein